VHELRKKLTTPERKIEIIGPVASFIHKIRGRFRQYGIIKLFAPYSHLPLDVVPNNWIIDVNPESLL